VLPGEDPVLARVGDALRAEDPARALRHLGVRWVLVEKENGVRADAIPTGTVVSDGRWLTLVDLGRPTEDLRHLRAEPPRGIVVSGGIAFLFVTSVSISQLGAASVRTRR
jgi:hypothetical protein